MSPPNTGRTDEQPASRPELPVEAVDWAWLLTVTIHPVKITIIEALRTFGHPATATDIWKSIDSPTVSRQKVINHIQRLVNVGAVDEVETVPFRGWKERYYFLSPQLLGSH